MEVQAEETLPIKPKRHGNMPIPSFLVAKILEFILKTSSTAFKGTKLIRKVDEQKIDNYIVRTVRRSVLGADGGISQTVKILKHGRVEEVWHVVLKAGQIIHKHLKK